MTDNMKKFLELVSKDEALKNELQALTEKFSDTTDWGGGALAR